MRTRIVTFSGLFLLLGAVSIQTVSAASTDCDRWLREYKQALADSQPVKTLVAAKKRARSVVPNKTPVVASSPVHHIRTPKLSPQEMLRRFHILCGDLPPDNEVGLVPQTPLQMLVPRSLDVPVTDLMAPPVVAAPPTTGGTPTQIGLVATPPLGVVPPVISVPATPSQPGSPSGPTAPPSGDLPPTSPITPVPPDTPVTPAPVPEPSSLVLLLTGFAGLATLGFKRAVN